MVIFAPASYPPDRLAGHAEHTAARLRQFAGAQVVSKLILP
jgi:hypothetical protein